jgi:tetratricopeptide (TPR) repeat protein
VHARARPLAWAKAAPAGAERAQLESLGYVVTAPAREVDLRVGGIDPKDVVSHLRDCEIIGALIEAKDYAGALARGEAYPGEGAFVSAQRAIAAQYAGEFARAEKHARTCAEQSPGFGDCWVALGNALASQEKFAEAEAALARAAEADPAESDAHVALGDLRIAQRDAAGAAQAYERAIASREGSAAAHWKLAALRLAAGDAGRANELLASVPADELARVEVVATLAASEIEGGLRDAARERLEAALSSHPGDEVLKRLLERAEP